MPLFLMVLVFFVAVSMFWNNSIKHNFMQGGILTCMNLKQLERQFLEYVEVEKGRSLKTVLNYDHYLTRFLEYTKVTDPKDITDEVVRNFRLWLNRQSTGNNR